jgi:glycosyltransferase involved in cell wall biosynthesis
MQNKETYIWGAGHYGLLTALDLENKGVKIKGFIDKKAKTIKTRLGVPVFEPNEIICDKKQDFQIIIAIQNEEAINEIIKKLESLGLRKNENFNISSILSVLYKPKLEPNNLTSYDVDLKKETKNPIIRIFVPTYNHTKFIRYCLNGILMQKTNFPFEIYIYDDHSTDGTSDIIQEYVGKYSNMIHDLQPENYYSKDNKLWLKKQVLNMKEHNCKYVAIIEGDDYWTDPYKLQIQVDFLENYNDFSMCSGGYLINDNFDGKQIAELISTKNYIGFEYDFLTAHSTNYLIKNFTRIYRTKTLPGYEIAKKYELFRDTHIAYYVLQNSKGYYFQRIFGNYNKHAGGTFGGLDDCKQMEIILKIFEEIYFETKNEQVKRILLSKVKYYVNFYVKTKKQYTYFYKKFTKKFPEFSDDIENRIF